MYAYIHTHTYVCYREVTELNKGLTQDYLSTFPSFQKLWLNRNCMSNKLFKR